MLCEAKLCSTLGPAPATVITSTGLGGHLVRMKMMMMMMTMRMMMWSPDKRGFSPQLHLLLTAQLVQELELVLGLRVASVHLAADHG